MFGVRVIVGNIYSVYLEGSIDFLGDLSSYFHLTMNDI